MGRDRPRCLVFMFESENIWVRTVVARHAFVMVTYTVHGGKGATRRTYKIVYLMERTKC